MTKIEKGEVLQIVWDELISWRLVLLTDYEIRDDETPETELWDRWDKEIKKHKKIVEAISDVYNNINDNIKIK